MGCTSSIPTPHRAAEAIRRDLAVPSVVAATLEYMGLWRDERGRTFPPMPSPLPGCKPQEGGKFYWSRDVAASVQQLVDRIAREGQTVGYLALQYPCGVGVAVFESVGPAEHFRRMGAGGSAGRSTCVRVPGVVGVIEAQGGGWTNAVYKITLSGSPAHAVPYSMLSISSATRCHNGEEPKYLLDEGTRARNACGTSKWNAATRRQIPVTLEIKVRGPPIRLATYALKSANDFPGRDPKQWDLIAVCSDGSERVVHAMGNHDRKWSGPSYYPAGRWQWRQWPCIHNFEANCFRLRIHDNHGDGGCTQLGQLRLFQYLSTEEGLRRWLVMDRARVRETEARLEEAPARLAADRKRLVEALEEDYRKRTEADRETLEEVRKLVGETEERLALEREKAAAAQRAKEEQAARDAEAARLAAKAEAEAKAKAEEEAAALLATQAEQEMPAMREAPVERPGFTRKLSSFLFGEQEPVAEPEAEPQAEAWYGEQEPTVEGVVVEMEPERYEMEPER